MDRMTNHDACIQARPWATIQRSAPQENLSAGHSCPCQQMVREIALRTNGEPVGLADRSSWRRATARQDGEPRAALGLVPISAANEYIVFSARNLARQAAG